MTPIPTRYLREIGMVHYLRRYWENAFPCKGWSYHQAMKELGRTYTLDDFETFGPDGRYPASDYPTTCMHCGDETHIATGRLHVFHRRLYAAADRSEIAQDDLQPGDLYYQREHLPAPGTSFRHCTSDWSNCNGYHLHCILPDGTPWDIDGRCSNCTMRDDTLHRCWVRHGDPERGEKVHVDKNGLTCSAGGGSIVVPGFHGWLHQSVLSEC